MAQPQGEDSLFAANQSAFIACTGLRKEESGRTETMLIAQKLMIFLVLMLVGLLLMKIRLLDEPTCRKLSSLVVNVANPAMILYSAIVDSTIPGSELLMTAAIAVGMFAMLLVIGAILPKLLKTEGQDASAYSLMTVFSNIGFMGLPLVAVLFGSSALLYVSVFIIPFNILIYTYGVALMQQPDPVTGKSSFSMREIINPGVVASVIAVAVYLLHIRLPEVIAVPTEYLSNLTAPLSMMVIGASLADVKIKEFFTDTRLLAFSFIKLLVVPVLTCFFLKPLIGDGVLLGVCIVMTGAPVASMTVMMAQQYGGEYTLISKGIALTTILSVVTIPLVFAIL